jgi:hypothetical protein
MAGPSQAQAAPPSDLQSLPAADLFLPLLTHAQSLHGFTVCDASGHHVYVSDSMLALTGFSARDLHGCARAKVFRDALSCARALSPLNGR